MRITYAVAQTPAGWAVFEDGVRVELLSERIDAVEVALILTAGSNATGRKARLTVADAKGCPETWTVEKAICDVTRQPA